MAALDSISFDISTYHDAVAVDGNRRSWLTDEGDAVDLIYFPQAPGVDIDVDDDAAITSYCWARAAAAQCGFVEAGPHRIAGRAAIRIVLKQPQDPTGRGRTYIASVWILFRDFSYMIKVTSPERGVTGWREAVVYDELSGAGKVEIAAPSGVKVVGAGGLRGWTTNVVDETIPPELHPNVAEAEKYDAQFPKHPLSRAREQLRRIVGTVNLDDELAAAAPYPPTNSSH